MHELSVVFTVLDHCEKVAKANNVNHINSVTVQIGEVSMVVPMYFEDVFKWAVNKRELMKGCKLKIETLKAVTRCNNCGKDYSTLEFAKKCPYCESEDTVLLRGNEFAIKEIEVD